MRFLKLVFSLNFLYLLLIAAQVVAIIFFCLYVPAVIPLAAAYAGAWIFSAITACVLLTRNGGAETKCAWFLLIAAIPFAGALLYLIATAKNRPYGALKIAGPALSPMGACAHGLCGTCEAGYDNAVYFPDGVKMFEAMFGEIKKAKMSVCIEFFIVSAGKIFDLFIDAVETAVRNGAQVRMIIDGFGSAFKLRRKDLKRIEGAGVQVKVFHKLIPLPRSRLNLRDHRKIVTVDGKVAFTGGINLADEYANISSPYGYWKDTGVAVYGTAAQVFEGMFEAMWQNGFQRKLEGGGKYLCLPYCDTPPAKGFCEELYVKLISAARERVHILTPYFCLSEKISGALEFAARRGVDVKVILPHIPDKPYAFELSKATAALMEPCGIRFFEFTPGFLHAKSLICDDNVCLGSYNFDFRSMRLNYECGIMFQGLICDQAERDFLNCLALSAPMTEGRISPAKRFSRFILRLFAPLI